MVNQKAQDGVQKSLDSVTGDKSTGVPGLVFVAVDKSGDEIVANASGKVCATEKYGLDWMADDCTERSEEL